MTKDEIIASVNGVLAKGFEVEPAQIKPEAHLYYDLGIDSLDAIDMLVYIEEKIGRTVDATLFKDVRKVQDVYDVLGKLLIEGQGGSAEIVLPNAPKPTALS